MSTNTDNSSSGEETEDRPERPDVTDYDTYEDFYRAVFDYLMSRNGVQKFTTEGHIYAGNELVRICPHCGAPSIISMMSDADSPSWRCVGETGLSDRHHFTRRNVPDERLNTDKQNPLAAKYESGDEAEEEED